MGMDPGHMPYEGLVLAIPPQFTMLNVSMMCVSALHKKYGDAVPVIPFSEMQDPKQAALFRRAMGGAEPEEVGEMMAEVQATDLSARSSDKKGGGGGAGGAAQEEEPNGGSKVRRSPKAERRRPRRSRRRRVRRRTAKRRRTGRFRTQTQTRRVRIRKLDGRGML